MRTEFKLISLVGAIGDAARRDLILGFCLAEDVFRGFFPVSVCSGRRLILLCFYVYFVLISGKGLFHGFTFAETVVVLSIYRPAVLIISFPCVIFRRRSGCGENSSNLQENDSNLRAGFLGSSRLVPDKKIVGIMFLVVSWNVS